MTPAVTQAKKAKVSFQLHEYEHDSASESYGLEAAEKMEVSAQQVFKTLVVQTDNQDLAVAVLPVASQLSLKLAAKALKAKKAVMADKARVEKVTGYVLGGVSPLGQRKRLTTVIDQSATGFATIFVSAGRRGLEIELSPTELANMLQADFIALTAP